MGFTFYIHPEIEFFLLRGLQPPEPLATAATSTTPPSGTAPTSAATPSMLEQMGISRRVQPPRGRARPARDRPALRRCPDDGGQRDDVPGRGA